MSSSHGRSPRAAPRRARRADPQDRRIDDARLAQNSRCVSANAIETVEGPDNDIVRGAKRHTD